MLDNNRFDDIKLYQLARKNCNGLTVEIVEDALGNLIEEMHNYVLLSTRSSRV